ncbi:MAG: YafY family transcriptional regulator [Anaerolineae bacterium]|nr:YafY family transcriptional regulator [Anaerolineae bacterium]
MRADRLIAMLMLLQSRGRMTACALADALEVSERTIYRDVDALSISGVPVYAERGPGGGIALLDSYRTNLTGLKEDEVRALFFMLTIPEPLLDLGVGKELKSALRKLAAALPRMQNAGPGDTRQRIYLDSVWWFQKDEAAPHLQTIQQALWQNRQLRIIYRLQFGTQVERLVSPYGLVAKTNVWYLVAARDTYLRVYRISRVLQAQLLSSSFEYPDDFDLSTFWKQWCADFERSRSHYTALVRVSPELMADFGYYFGDNAPAILASATPPDAGGWVTLTLPFEGFQEARSRILGLGRAIEVLEPQALRLSVADFARQVVNLYDA